MSLSIFSYLKSYIPTEKRNPQEDYLTQLFAWILENIPGTATSYVRFLCDKNSNINIPISDDTLIKVDTQRVVSSGRIDMFLSVDDKWGIICEHKIDSELSENQIEKYMLSSLELENRKLFSILLTKDKSQHTQKADVSLIWKDIYELFSDLLSSYTEENYFVIKQFLLYLEENGMGKEEPIKINLFSSYFNFQEVNKRLNGIFESLVSQNWRLLCPNLENIDPNFTRYQPKFKKEWYGRKGIDFFSTWYPLPGLFAGIIMDTSDHLICPIDKNKGPDFVVLLDYNYDRQNQGIRQNFLSSDEFIELKARLKTNHLSFELLLDNELKNQWRILVLKKTLVDILDNLSTYEEQYQAVLDEIKLGINLLCQVKFKNKLE